MSIGVILAVIALLCAIGDYFLPKRHLLDIGLGAAALALLV